MKYCSYCGKEILDGAVYCPHCGSHLYASNSVQEPQKNESSFKGGVVGFVLTFFFGLLGFILCLLLGDEKCKKSATTTFIVTLILGVICGIFAYSYIMELFYEIINM